MLCIANARSLAITAGNASKSQTCENCDEVRCVVVVDDDDAWYLDNMIPTQ